jgi:hypothetical protein
MKVLTLPGNPKPTTDIHIIPTQAEGGDRIKQAKETHSNARELIIDTVDKFTCHRRSPAEPDYVHFSITAINL